jgi:hypothetical protein
MLIRQLSGLIVIVIVIAIVAALAACAAPLGYKTAFTDKAVAGTSRRFEGSVDETFRAAKQTLVQRGFNLDLVEASTGTIKADRDIADPKKKEISYIISATLDISAGSSAAETMVTIAASQQTVAHTARHEWTSVLGILPMPVPGKKYNTLVTKEGALQDPELYTEFFAAIDRNIKQARLAAQRSPAVAAPQTAGPMATPVSVSNPNQ